MEHRTKMTRSERAKQFMPFAALKGFEEALREKERVVVLKTELSEERKEEINFYLSNIHKNDIVRVTHYNMQQYVETTGMISKINLDSQYVLVVNEKIFFCDIVDIYKLDNME